MSLLTATTVEEVKRLIELGHDVNCKDIGGNSVLHRACAKGNLDIVKVLCEAGADVNKESWGFFPIDNAAEAGYLNIVKYLIENYPDVRLDNAVYLASIFGHTDVLDYLLTLNLELAKPVFNLNNKLFNPLRGACKYGQIDVVDRLLNAGADTNIVDAFGFSVMVAATYKNRLDIVKKLVMFGADYHRDGGEALLVSCNHSYDKISEFLIGLGCDVNYCMRNVTPLMYACENNNLKIVKLLLERGADPDFVNDYGKTAIDYVSDDEIRALFIKN